MIHITWNSFLCHTLLFDRGQREDKSVFAVFSIVICLSSVICFNFALNYYEVVGVDLCMQTRHHCLKKKKITTVSFTVQTIAFRFFVANEFVFLFYIYFEQNNLV